MQFKEINKDNPLILKWVVEYKCADLPYNPDIIEKAISNSLGPIRTHFIKKGMENRHGFKIYREA